MTLATIVEWVKLAEAAYVSAAFGIGVVLIAGLAVVASLRAQDERRTHHGAAIALDVVAALSVLAITAAIVFGIDVMTKK